MVVVVIFALCVGFTLYVMGINLNPISVVIGCIRQRKQRREEDLRRLGTFHRRLLAQTSELLARVNDLDQQSKYQTEPDRWSFGMCLLCTQLVNLSEQVSVLESYLKKQDIPAVRHQLFQSLNLAHKLSRELNDLKYQLHTESARPKSLASKI